MALLDTIQRSKYCIFIESAESVPLSSKLKKESLSPRLYEEIKYMKVFQPKKGEKLFSEGLEKAMDCKISYDISDISDISEFPFLEIPDLYNWGVRSIYD